MGAVGEKEYVRPEPAIHGFALKLRPSAKQLLLLELQALGHRVARERHFKREMTRRRAQGLSNGLEAWIARRHREELELPLRDCDIEQMTEQLEDMGSGF